MTLEGSAVQHPSASSVRMSSVGVVMEFLFARFRMRDFILHSWEASLKVFLLRRW